MNENSVPNYFRVCCFRIWAENWNISFGKLNMAAFMSKKHVNFAEKCLSWFFFQIEIARSLSFFNFSQPSVHNNRVVWRYTFPNLVSDFRNSEWRIQYGGHNFDKSLKLVEIIRTQVFGVAESKSAIKFSKFKIMDPIWRTEIRKTREKFDEIVHYYICEVVESKSVVRFSLSKIANPIWRLEWLKRSGTW